MTELLVIGILWWGASGSAGTLQWADTVQVRGQTAQRLGRAVDRLTAPPLNAPEFVLSDVNFALTRRFTEYSGDISGRVLAALDEAAPLLNRRADIFPALLAGFAAHQKPDGHFGAEQELDRSVDQKRDMPILWGNGRLLFALARYGEAHEDPAVLDAARRLGDYLCSTRKYYGKEENFRAVGGAYASGFTTCYPSVVDALAALAAATGDPKYADEARFIANLSLLDDAFDRHHSHGRLTTYRGMLDLDWLTGRRDFVDKVRDFCSRIAADYELPTGGLTEMFDRDYPLDEGCSVADWLWVNLLLWRATGEGAYLDAAEHTLRNHLLPAQFPNGGFGHRRLRALKDGGRTWTGGGFEPFGTEAYWCCAMHGTQALAEAARYAVVLRGETVVLTWLAEVDADLRIGQRRLHVAPRRTGPGQWEVRVRSDSPGVVKFRLRVPAWARTLRADGREQAAGGWMEMSRSVVGEQVFQVYFQQEVRLQGAGTAPPAPGEPVRVFAGPDLYCLPDVEVGDAVLEPQAAPSIVLAADKPVDGALPVVIEGPNGARQRGRLVPLADRPPGGCRHLFRVGRVDAAAFADLEKSAAAVPPPGRPITLIVSCEGQYELYLNGRRLASGSGPAEALLREAYVPQGDNVLVVRARSKADRPGLIGLIRAGGRTTVTDAAQWSAGACPTTTPAGWMIDASAAIPGAAKIDDLGPWGMPPWGHVAAQYAGTGARWIWPAGGQPGTWVALRCALRAE